MQARKVIYLTLVCILFGCGKKTPKEPDVSYAMSEQESQYLTKAKGAVEVGAKIDPKFLVKAAREGWYYLAKYCLDNGVDVNFVDEHGGTVLYRSIQYGKCNDLIKYALFDDVTQFEKSNDIVKLLLARGADVNVKNVDGDTPLHQAAHNGNNEIVKLLMTMGANAKAKDFYGNGPLWQAGFYYGDAATVQLLIDADADVNAKSHHDQTLLAYLKKQLTGGIPNRTRARNTEIIKILIKRGAKE